MAITTTAGEAAIAAAVGGQKLDVVTLVIGDGNGAAVTPNTAQTALVKQVDSVKVKAVYTKPSNPNYIYIEGEIPFDQGGYTIREAGALDSKGKLIVVGAYAEIAKPAAGDSEARALTVRLIASVSNTDAFNLVFSEGDNAGGLYSVGTIIQHVHNVLPSGQRLLPCDGREYLKADYPKLAEVLPPVSVGEVWEAADQSASVGYRGIDISDDGQKLIIGGNVSPYLGYSTDGGVTLTPVASNPFQANTKEVMDVAISGDGSKAVAVGYFGYICLSTDAGATWGANINPWGSGSHIEACAINETGSIIVIGGHPGLSVSTDGGATFGAAVPVDTSTGDVLCIAMLPDASVMLAGAENGKIRRSTDQGVSWSVVASIGALRIRDIAIHGSNAIAVIDNGDVYRSTDSGQNWTKVASLGSSFWGCDIAGDLAILTAGSSTYHLSTNAGETFSLGTAPSSVTSVALTQDGERAAAGAASVLMSLSSAADPEFRVPTHGADMANPTLSKIVADI